MVITTIVVNQRVKKILVDQGSSANELFWSVFKKLNIFETQIQTYLGPLLDFAGERVHMRGYIDLLTQPSVREKHTGP